MFKHLLIPTDGSPRSRKAAKAAVAFAKELGAKATVYYALQVIPAYSAGGFVPLSVLEPFESGERRRAQKHLDEVVKLARAAGVPCEVRMTRPDAVHEGIIDAAKKSKCDVIFMASHGHGELASFVVGSVTLKVLAHSKVPVVVFR